MSGDGCCRCDEEPGGPSRVIRGMNKTALLLALTSSLAACGNPEPAREEPSATTASSAASLAERFGDAKIVVNADGFGANGGEPVRFGAKREEADATASKAYGEAGEQSSNGECGAGPMEFSQFGPLQLAYLDGKFAGWFLRDGDGVVTSDGIKPGVTTMDALKGERQVQEIDTTLEGEFQYITADYGTITGFADESGKITALQAGVSCFFR